MKKTFLSLVLILSLTTSRPSYALFGEDAALTIPYLIQIIMQAIKQYNEMKAILQQAKDTKALLKSLNEGMDTAINLIRALPLKDEKILGDLKNYQDALREIRRLYGDVPMGPESSMYNTHDQTIAESIKLVNAIQEYATVQEKNADQIGDSSNYMSPKGSARMNARTNAAVLHTLNQILRINGQYLKLQSESLGITTKAEKEQTFHYQKVNNDIKRNFRSFDGDFKVPRF